MTRETLRIGIAEDWSVQDFGDMMMNLQFLRNIALLSELDRGTTETVLSLFEGPLRNGAQFERDTEAFNRLRSQFFQAQLNIVYESLEDIYWLKIKRLKFASPGFVDIAGAGKIVEQIRIFLTDIYDRYASRADRKITRETAEQELLSKKIANAEAILKLGRHAGLDQETSRLLVAEVLHVDEFFSQKTTHGKVVEIKKLKG